MFKRLEGVDVQAQYLIAATRDPAFLNRISQFFGNGGFEIGMHPELLKIYDRHEPLYHMSVFGPHEWGKYFHAHLSDANKLMLVPFPWGWQILRKPCPFSPEQTVQNSHVAFVTLPKLQQAQLTVANWLRNETCADSGYSGMVGGDTRYHLPDSPDLTGKVCNLGWRLAYPRPVPNPDKLDYYYQTIALPPEYQVASVLEIVTMIKLFEALGQPVLRWWLRAQDVPPIWGWCADEKDGHQALVGQINRNGQAVPEVEFCAESDLAIGPDCFHMEPPGVWVVRRAGV